MKTFRVEISTFMLIDAVEDLDAIAEARYHFQQVCTRGDEPALAREASFDVSVMMCPKCFSPDCRGDSCKPKRVALPVIRRDLA